ncbi:sulfite exporter TauE/SafE family protein [Laspinema olomoucense]|uniref:sulfite exporter TauE/SafE family protein n=1 Tax=Laspinema olomoucense TaxID=3231600 RepID=UPI0021BB6701|nr:sulfite exporter TauE/SafE family protein [Laspinema sp. D3c]MCT7994224.1 sulfite exporter TauE/SafE family protein [Laspinema sp. D3c]
MSLAILFGLGICTGLLAGLFGLGGGILIVPLLNFWGFPVVTAAATSLIGVFLTALSGTIRYSWTKQLNWRNALQIALFGVPAVQIGAWLARHLPDNALAISFSLLLLGAIYLMGLRKTLIDTEIFASLLDPDSPDILVKNQTRSRWDFAKIGSLGGAIAGLFGIGGGIVMVPLQVLLLGESIASAVPTTLAAVTAIAASGLAQYAWNGNVLWIPGLCIGCGGILGVQLGTRLLPHLSATLINTLFRLILFVLSLYMMRQGLVSVIV